MCRPGTSALRRSNRVSAHWAGSTAFALSVEVKPKANQSEGDEEGDKLVGHKARSYRGYAQRPRSDSARLTDQGAIGGLKPVNQKTAGLPWPSLHRGAQPTAPPGGARRRCRIPAA